MYSRDHRALRRTIASGVPGVCRVRVQGKGQRIPECRQQHACRRQPHRIHTTPGVAHLPQAMGAVQGTRCQSVRPYRKAQIRLRLRLRRLPRPPGRAPHTLRRVLHPVGLNHGTVCVGTTLSLSPTCAARPSRRGLPRELSVWSATGRKVLKIDSDGGVVV